MRPTAWRCCLRLLGAEVQIVYSGRSAGGAATYRPERRPARHRNAGDGRPRSGAAHPAAAGVPDVLLIAMTGWGQEEDRRRSQKAGFDYHLIKPADVGALETLLMSVERSPGSRAASARHLN
jgi:hypothetical protein